MITERIAGPGIAGYDLRAPVVDQSVNIGPLRWRKVKTILPTKYNGDDVRFHFVLEANYGSGWTQIPVVIDE